MRSLDRSWRDTLSIDHFVVSASACSDIDLAGAQRVYSQILSASHGAAAIKATLLNHA
jgi:hypothetical protein